MNGCSMASSSRLLLTYEPEQKLGKAIACTLHDSHAYFYRSARCLATWHVRESVSTDRSKLQQEVKSELPPLSDWVRWDEQPRPGHFWCEDLAKVRQWFLCSGRSPKVALKSMVDLSSLSYYCTARKDCDLQDPTAPPRSREHSALAVQATPGRRLRVQGGRTPRHNPTSLLRASPSRASQPSAR